MGVIINLGEYRIRFHKARFKWRTSGCSYRELARFAGVSLERARKWEQLFMKEKLRERKGKK